MSINLQQQTLPETASSAKRPHKNQHSKLQSQGNLQDAFASHSSLLKVKMSKENMEFKQDQKQERSLTSSSFLNCQEPFKDVSRSAEKGLNQLDDFSDGLERFQTQRQNARAGRTQHGLSSRVSGKSSPKMDLSRLRNSMDKENMSQALVGNGRAKEDVSELSSQVKRSLSERKQMHQKSKMEPIIDADNTRDDSDRTPLGELSGIRSAEKQKTAVGEDLSNEFHNLSHDQQKLLFQLVKHVKNQALESEQQQQSRKLPQDQFLSPELFKEYQSHEFTYQKNGESLNSQEQRDVQKKLESAQASIHIRSQEMKKENWQAPPAYQDYSQHQLNTAQKPTHTSVNKETLSLFNQKQNSRSKHQAETPCNTGHTRESLNLDSSSGMASGHGNLGGFTAALFITPPKVDQSSSEDMDPNSNFKTQSNLNAISSIKKLPVDSPNVSARHLNRDPQIAQQIEEDFKQNSSLENTIFNLYNTVVSERERSQAKRNKANYLLGQIRQEQNQQDSSQQSQQHQFTSKVYPSQFNMSAVLNEQSNVQLRMSAQSSPNTSFTTADFHPNTSQQPQATQDSIESNLLRMMDDDQPAQPLLYKLAPQADDRQHEDYSAFDLNVRRRTTSDNTIVTDSANSIFFNKNTLIQGHQRLQQIDQQSVGLSDQQEVQPRCPDKASVSDCLSSLNVSSSCFIPTTAATKPVKGTKKGNQGTVSSQPSTNEDIKSISSSTVGKAESDQSAQVSKSKKEVALLQVRKEAESGDASIIKKNYHKGAQKWGIYKLQELEAKKKKDGSKEAPGKGGKKPHFPEHGWTCNKCQNYNFSGRLKCNRCFKLKSKEDLEGKPKHLLKLDGSGLADETEFKPKNGRKRRDPSLDSDDKLRSMQEALQEVSIKSGGDRKETTGKKKSQLNTRKRQQKENESKLNLSKSAAKSAELFQNQTDRKSPKDPHIDLKKCESPQPDSSSPGTGSKDNLGDGKKLLKPRVGDWFCLNCSNYNYSFRETCKMCDLHKLDACKITVSEHELASLHSVPINTQEKFNALSELAFQQSRATLIQPPVSQMSLSQHPQGPYNTCMPAQMHMQHQAVPCAQQQPEITSPPHNFCGNSYSRFSDSTIDHQNGLNIWAQRCMMPQDEHQYQMARQQAPQYNANCTFNNNSMGGQGFSQQMMASHNLMVNQQRSQLPPQQMHQMYSLQQQVPAQSQLKIQQSFSSDYLSHPQMMQVQQSQHQYYPQQQPQQCDPRVFQQQSQQQPCYPSSEAMAGFFTNHQQSMAVASQAMRNRQMQQAQQQQYEMQSQQQFYGNAQQTRQCQLAYPEQQRGANPQHQSSPQNSCQHQF